MSKSKKYVQIGVTAMRDPVTGEMLPSVPLFIRREDADSSAVAQIRIGTLAHELASKMDEYLTALAKAGMEP